MQVAFDHLVHFIQVHPQQAVKQMSMLGLHAVAGGRHENWGTFNSLCYFDLSYIEFLGLEHPDVAEQAREYGLIDQLLLDLPKGEGLGTIALRTDNMEESAAILRSKGIRVRGPFPGSRQRSDGRVISWKMLFLERESDDLPLPFFIQWEQTDEERRADLAQNGIIAPHPAGEIALDYVAYAVGDLDKTGKQWQDLFSLEAKEPYFHKQWGATCQILSLTGGNLLFCQPEGKGIVSEVLQKRGERPFLVNLRGADIHKVNYISGSIYQL